jgi:hypothetical protein
MREMLKPMNEILTFLLELAMLLALGYWGFYGDKSVWVKWLLGIGLPLLAAVVWSIWLAPKAPHRLGSTGGNLLSLILFLLAATVLFFTPHIALAIIFALTAIANRVLIIIWKQW